MQRKNKIRISMYIALSLLVIVQLGDIITSLIADQKHGTEFETNPNYVAGYPIWLLIAGKIVGTGLFIWALLKYYHNFNVYWRYVFTYVLVFAIVLFGAIVVGNIKLIQKDVGVPQPLPKEERVEAYNVYVHEMKAVNNLVPEQAKQYKPPLALTMFMWSFIVFILWNDFEKGVK